MGITVDVSQLEGFADKISSLNAEQKELFFQDSCNELANRLLALVIPRTPVRSGVLRGGWTNNQSGSGFSVMSSGGSYSVTLTNPTPYASYVESGHRQTPGRYVPAIGKRLKASWVEGQHFLKLSEDDLMGIAPGVLQSKLDAFLRTVF